MINNDIINDLLNRPDISVTGLVEFIVCNLAPQYKNVYACGIKHMFDPCKPTHSTRLTFVEFANSNDSIYFGYNFTNNTIAIIKKLNDGTETGCNYVPTNNINQPLDLNYDQSDYMSEGTWLHEVYLLVTTLLTKQESDELLKLVMQMENEPDMIKRSDFILKSCEVSDMCNFKRT